MTGERRAHLRPLNTAILWGLAATFIAMVMWVEMLPEQTYGQDSYAYWLTGHVADLYRENPGQENAYLYSPAFASVIWPLTLLPWPAFFLAWSALGAGCLFWLVRPLSPRWAVAVGILWVPQVLIGNVYLPLAVMLAVGLRYPAVWAFGILTKITPGVGLLWFAVRGEWRKLAIAAAVTVAVAVTSFALAPYLWVEWLTFLAGNRDSEVAGGSVLLLPLRVVVAVTLIVVAARSDRPWLLAVALVPIASTVIGGPSALAPLLAIPRLLRREAGPLRRPTSQAGSLAGPSSRPTSQAGSLVAASSHPTTRAAASRGV